MKKIGAILIVLLLLLQYRIWLDSGGIPEILQLQAEIDSTQAEVDRLKERNLALEAEVSDLKLGLDAIEERARSEMGMIGKDEVYYQVIEPAPEAHRADQTADSVSAADKTRNNKKQGQ